MWPSIAAPVSAINQNIRETQLVRACRWSRCRCTNIIFAPPPSELANCLTARNITIVNGGSSFGLLGVVGRRTLEKGGKLVGIIPEFFTSE